MPRWKELKRFCEKDGWELYKDTDHYFYRKRMDDGQVKMTKVSKGSGEIHTRMWQQILKNSYKLHRNILTSSYREKLPKSIAMREFFVYTESQKMKEERQEADYE